MCTQMCFAFTYTVAASLSDPSAQIYTELVFPRLCHQMATFSAILAFCEGNPAGHRWIARTQASDAKR